MEDVIKLLSKRIKQDKIFSKKDILRIYVLLMGEFQVTTIKDIYFVKPKTEKYLMGYHVDNHKIHVSYYQIEKNTDARRTNYEILFAILHEIRHAKQMEYAIFNDNELSSIYRICFDYINNLNNITAIYYHLYHSYFPIEFNADISAYFYMIHICDRLEDEDYKAYYKILMMERLNNIDQLNQNSLLGVLFDEEFLVKVRNTLSAYDIVTNGLEKNIDASKKELRMLL